jgi:hypothetical protein
VWTTPAGTVHDDGSTTDRRPPAVTDFSAAQPAPTAPCRRPRTTPTTAAHIAENLELALAEISSRAPP